MSLHERDRKFLLLACGAAEGARRPPARLGDRPEPVWAALLAREGSEEPVAKAVFLAGDREDAVAKLLASVPKADGPEFTLYLTVEPKAGFDRIPPATESVRRLGVKRVVIGTLDPAQRFRREGTHTLERMGIEVVLADGEEARRCQNLLDDYSKWLQRGVAVLRARVEVEALPSGVLDLKFSDQAAVPDSVDAVVGRAGRMPKAPSSAWRVILDAEGWERPSEGTVLYQSLDGPAIPGAKRVAFRDGLPDLGALLRDLGSLGLVSVEIANDPELFRAALGAGLVDGLMVQFGDESGSKAISRVSRVRLSQGGDPLELRLDGARFADGSANRYLEARVELC